MTIVKVEGEVSSEKQLTEAGEVFNIFETAKNLEQSRRKLLTKVDLWKSMADFLQRSLEREKVKFKKIEEAFVLAKVSSMKKNEKERQNTDSELQKLKKQV